MNISEDVYASADIDSINEAIRHSTIDVPLPEVRQNLAATHQQLRDIVASTPQEDLGKPYRWFLPDHPDADDDASMLHKVAGNSSQHFEEHLPWMRAIVDLAAP
jgi:hypothetical protein